MDDAKPVSQGTEQLYHLLVLWRQLKDSLPRRNRTAALKEVLATTEAVLRTAAEAHYSGQIMEVQINLYTPTMLPGFDEDGWKMKSPPDNGED